MYYYIVIVLCHRQYTALCLRPPLGGAPCIQVYLCRLRSPRAALIFFWPPLKVIRHPDPTAAGPMQEAVCIGTKAPPTSQYV
ncbi:hypothetical protein GDO81_019201 [Engystomops pustulosus]|uniref:Secreted protein n=1 Tax=Engystomops pustulosus TaxID=76066 RepID=A0AAV6YGQ3_ENGPU|nr:hypothetical protein GDO81_019201 [Engystomops pustulosus]